MLEKKADDGQVLGLLPSMYDIGKQAQKWAHQCGGKKGTTQKQQGALTAKPGFLDTIRCPNAGSSSMWRKPSL